MCLRNKTERKALEPESLVTVLISSFILSTYTVSLMAVVRSNSVSLFLFAF